MADQSRQTLPKEYEQKRADLEKAFDHFLAEFGVLKKERGELVKKILSRVEQEKIKRIRSELK